MCSVQEEGNDIPMKEKEKSKSRVCMKCGGEAVLITRINDPLCRDCFMVYTTHKFRAAIGKSKLIRDGETVLVAYSGGQASSCLLQLIRDGLSEKAHKKLRFKPSLLFIDEGAALGMSAEERLVSCQSILQVLGKTGFPCHIRSLEEAMDSSFVSDNNGRDSMASTALPDFDLDSQAEDQSVEGDTSDKKSNKKSKEKFSIDSDFKQKYLQYDESEVKLKELLKSLKSVTAKEDLIRSLRYNILIDTARKHGNTKVMMGDCSTRLSVRLLSDISQGRGAHVAMETVDTARKHGNTKVMMGDCSTRLSVRLLSDISQGRGAHVAMETAFADKRLDDIMIVRPIRDFSSKEVALYNVLNDVETVFIPTLTTKASANSSIDQLTETFVTGLQADYGSTVHNIMRTGEKLTTEKQKRSDQRCVICHGPLDTSTGQASALHAVEFSQEISQKKAKKSSECCGEGDGSCNSSKNRLEKSDVLSTLCYGCRLMVKDLSDVNKLPEYVRHDISNRVSRSKMRADIQDYLLDDDDTVK